MAYSGWYTYYTKKQTKTNSSTLFTKAIWNRFSLDIAAGVINAKWIGSVPHDRLKNTTSDAAIAI
jgi:hypothetical protein